MTNEELQQVVAAVIASLKTNGKTISQLTPVTTMSDSDNLEVSGGKKIAFSYLKAAVAAAVTVTSNDIKGYVVIESTSELPSNPSADEQMKGYILDTTLYVYVGEGGDTLSGKYQSVELQGPQGEPGQPGHDGVDLGEVALINDLTTGGEGSALSAEMGKLLGEKSGKILNINDNEVYRLWVGTQDEFDELGGVYDNDVIYLVGSKYQSPTITSITHGTQSGNTMQFTAVLEPVGSTATVTWSVVPTPSGSASINSSGLLTITADCSVVVTATCGNSTMSTSSISLVFAPDPNANIIFEDSNVKSAMLATLGKSSDGNITYGEAAAAHWPMTRAIVIFSDYKTGNNAITKFNEWKYFPGLVFCGCVDDATSLTEICLPPLGNMNATSNMQIKNIAVENLVIPATSLTSTVVSNCSELKYLKFTSTLLSITITSSVATISSCSKLREVDFSETQFTTFGRWLIAACTNLHIVRLPHTLTAFGGQPLRDCANTQYLVLGDSVNGSDLTSFSANLYNGPQSLNVVLYAPYSAGQITEFSTTNGSVAKIYVPDDDVESYKSDSVFSSLASKIYGISELPSGWETPTPLT